jgi:hypothetical protein
MWFFWVSLIYFVFALGCRLFDGYSGPIFGSGWISYLLLISILYAIACLIFGLKTWRDEGEAGSR